MNGFNAEPGERSAPRHVDGRRRARARSNPALPTWARTSPVALSMTRMAAESLRPERLHALARQRLEARLQPGVDREAMDLSGPAPPRPPPPPHGRRASGKAGAPPARARPWRRLPPRRSGRRGNRARSSTRSRARRAASAKRSGRRSSGRLRQCDQQRGLGEGEALRLLAEVGQGRGAHALEIAAVGREREVERRGCASFDSRCSICAARTIWRSLASAVRSSRGSSRRATCMVSVEPPDTMRPCRTSCAPARRSASGSTPGWRSKRASS